VLALAIAWQLLRGRPGANWPLAGYAAIAGYTIAFAGGLNPYWVAAGAVCALAVRFAFYPRQVRWAEMAVMAYVVWRSVGLLLMW